MSSKNWFNVNICLSVKDVPKLATAFSIPFLLKPTTSIYPSTKKIFSNLFDSFLAKSKLYKFEPFLKKEVSGELIYFARKSLFSIILPPNAIGCPEILFIGKINRPLNLST